MMIYKPNSNCLINDIYTKEIIDQSFKYYFGDFYYVSNERGSILYKIANADKYIKKEVLDKMMEDNDFLVRTDRHFVPSFDCNIPPKDVVCSVEVLHKKWYPVTGYSFDWETVSYREW